MFPIISALLPFLLGLPIEPALQKLTTTQPTVLCDPTSLTSCAPVSSTAGLSTSGPVAVDSPAAYPPVFIGARGSTAVPSAMSTDGDVTAVWTTLNGAVNMVLRQTDGTAVPVSDGGPGGSTSNTTRVIHSTDDPITVAVKAEDAASANGDFGMVINTVRQDTIGSSTSADGDYSPLKTDSSGRLYTVTTCSNCTGTGVSVNEDVGSANADPGTPAYAIRQDTPANLTSADLDYAPLKVDNVGRLWVNGSGVTQPVGGVAAADAAVSGNPVYIAAYGSSAVPTAMSTNGDVTPFWTTLNGALNVVMRNTDGTSAIFVGIEDAAETAGGNLAMVGSVRRDTPASSAGTTGDNATINTNADGAVWTSPLPSIAGGWSVFNATAADGATACTNTAQSVKGSQGVFGGYFINNPNTSDEWLHVYNVASGGVTVGTTNPAMSFRIPGTATNSVGANMEITMGVQFGTAISIACTSTAGGNGAPANALEANILYK